jgi:hydrogenase maturation factor
MKRNNLPALGKIHPDFFNRHIYPKLGAPNPAVILKPQNGVDFGVVDLGSSVIVLSTDPFYIARELGIKRAAWFAVHIIASDIAVSGIRPQYLAIDLNLPPEILESELIQLWDTVDKECRKLGISVVTGHTARYAGCNYPFVGGATMFGIGSKKELIKPRAYCGDQIIVSKGPAIESTGLLAAYFPQVLEDKYGKVFVKRAQDVFYQMSTVKDALVVASVGGVTAMHDATECGVFGGLFEIALHSQVGMRIYPEEMIMQEEVALTCACFGIDPYKSISEGTLLATVRPAKSKSVIRALKDNGIPASVAGEVVKKKEGMRVVQGNKSSLLKHPRVDPFWGKFEEHLLKRNERKNT